MNSDLSDDYAINVLERYVTGRYGNLNRRVSTHFADLRDFSSIRALVKLVQPDVVIHLAAVSPVSYSYDHPNEVIETNLLGTVNLAEACRKNCEHLEAFIFGGTSEEYGTTPDRPATEESRCFPNSPYSVSKHSATEYLLYLNRAFKFPAIISRATNSYGRKNDTHFFIEKLVYQMLRDPHGNVYLGDTQQIRDFMYVDDHVNAYLSLLEKREKGLGKIFNFATGEAKPLDQVIDLVSKLSEFKGEIITGSIPKRPLDIYDHLIDYSKASRELGWKPLFDLKSGLQKTIEHWRNEIQRIPLVAQ
jgi:nucleoside-diphosphate-sugar epimerase